MVPLKKEEKKEMLQEQTGGDWQVSGWLVIYTQTIPHDVKRAK